MVKTALVSFGVFAAAIGTISQFSSNSEKVQQISPTCSSPQILETLRAERYLDIGAEELPDSVGPVGTVGNLLYCTAMFGQVPNEFVVQVLENGQFRVKRTVVATRFQVQSLGTVGPVNFEQIKKNKCLKENNQWFGCQ